MSDVRRAEGRDLEALGRLGAMLVRVHYAFDSKRFIAPMEDLEKGYAAFLGRVMDDKDAAVFVADRDGAVVGYVFVALEPPSWKELRAAAGFIHDVAVAEEARRSGVATQLLRVAIEWLRSRGAPRVILGSASANTGAQALFHRFGFRDTMIEMTMEL